MNKAAGATGRRCCRHMAGARHMHIGESLCAFVQNSGQVNDDIRPRHHPWQRGRPGDIGLHDIHLPHIAQQAQMVGALGRAAGDAHAPAATGEGFGDGGADKARTANQGGQTRAERRKGSLAMHDSALAALRGC